MSDSIDENYTGRAAHTAERSGDAVCNSTDSADSRCSASSEALDQDDIRNDAEPADSQCATSSETSAQDDIYNGAEPTDNLRAASSEALAGVRRRINEIDAQLAPLLARRMACSAQVAQIKSAEGIPVLDASREETVVGLAAQRAQPYGSYVASVYRSLMGVSREMQRDMLRRVSPLAKRIQEAADRQPTAQAAGAITGTVACYGVDGAFCSRTAKLLYPNARLLYCEKFADVFEAVETGRAVRGVTPVENSTAGSVTEVYDLILQYRHSITAGVSMGIRQNLLACPGADLSTVRTVYSHPQALAQSEAFLKARGYTAVSYASTAAAAKMVGEKRDVHLAAIGSAEAAELYGLRILASGIQANENNATRFISISREMRIASDANKVSLVFSLPHVTGSLHRLLGHFAARGLNLTKLESRAARRGGFQYVFYVDFAGASDSQVLASLLTALEDETEDLAFLGNYREITVEA
ncbi:MAG: prephenate dehydratase [Clostridiales bacterium]|nr:prephenate dehydratase [Clostridiales bacterium]